MTRYRLPIEIQLLEEGYYLATSPALPGFLVQAKTVEEVLRLAPGVAQSLIEAMREKGVPLPKHCNLLNHLFMLNSSCQYDIPPVDQETPQAGLRVCPTRSRLP